LAIPLLEKSVKLNSKDPAAWFGLGQAKSLAEDFSGADEAFHKVIEIAGNSNIGEAARAELTKLAESQLRKSGVRGNRPDALMYCLSALEKFSKLSDDELKPILYEIAMAGEKGFDINNPDKRYTFKSIEGDFSGLQAVCYMYTASQRLLPGQNLGIDLSREYAKALSLFKGSSP